MGTRHYWCKKCMNARTAQKYEDNRIYLFKYLSSHPCVDCGESDPYVLEFDHIELKGKTGKSISSMTCNSKKVLDREIAKCEVRCSNCHTRRTRIQMGWRDYGALIKNQDLSG